MRPNIMAAKTTVPIIPRVPGIYQIRCRPNGKIYVGSAVNLCERWREHRRALHRGNHHNAHLQSAWILLGEASFEFEILEYVQEAQLLTAEQKWIDWTDCTHQQIGYNISALATSHGRKMPLTWNGFRDPDGNSVSIVNLTQFCRQNRLDFPSMHRLARGVSKLKSYKGWTHENSVRKRAYVKTYEGFIDPYGNPAAHITNLADFCRKRGLDKTHMVAVANGRIVSHRGWTHSCGKRRQPAREYTGFVAPEGAFTIITNLATFCRECDLCVVHMHEVKSGKRPSHKGWTWRNHDETEIARWRRPSQAHKSPDLGDQPLPPTAR